MNKEWHLSKEVTCSQLHLSGHGQLHCSVLCATCAGIALKGVGGATDVTRFVLQAEEKGLKNK